MNNEINKAYYFHSKKHAKSMKLKTLNEVAKSLCKIHISKEQGTGFFLLINVSKEKILYMLVTAFHVIKNKTINKNKDIKIIIYNGKKEFNINMDKNKRLIVYDSIEDIIGIEIKEEDNIINNVKFLNYDINCKKDNYKNYLEEDAFILHHPENRDLECNSGKILTFIKGCDYEFEHNLDTERGSSGAPILLFENEKEGPKVIGMHKCYPSGQNKLKTNIGNFIDILIEKVINN